MSGGYRRGNPPTELAGLINELDEITRRLDVLERPSGEQLAKVVEELTAWVEDIQAQLDDYLSNDAYTKAQVDALVASPGNIAPGNVSASGSGTFPGGVNSTDAYNRLLTYGGPYRATWTHSDGWLGYVPSSRRFKTGVKPATFALDDVLKLQAHFFRYLAPPPYDQAQQPEMLNLLAEDTHEAGFTWAVDYDDDGKPFGIRGDVVALIVLEGLRALTAEVRGSHSRR
jgi:hypothetical protein